MGLHNIASVRNRKTNEVHITKDGFYTLCGAKYYELYTATEFTPRQQKSTVT